MPVVIVGGIGGAGWGCTCKSFRSGEPDGLIVLRAMARAADVEFELTKKWPDGKMDFRAWTDLKNIYDVVYDPDGLHSGFCKHCAACAVYVAGNWLQTAFETTKGEIEWKRTASKQLKALQRKLDRLQRKAT